MVRVCQQNLLTVINCQYGQECGGVYERTCVILDVELELLSWILTGFVIAKMQSYYCNEKVLTLTAWFSLIRFRGFHFDSIPENLLWSSSQCHKFSVIGIILSYCRPVRFLYPLLQRSWKGVYWFHLVRPSVRPSVCPSVDRIVSTLYLQQYSSDPFHIC